jgi:hypothetical protein
MIFNFSFFFFLKIFVSKYLKRTGKRDSSGKKVVNSKKSYLYFFKKNTKTASITSNFFVLFDHTSNINGVVLGFCKNSFGSVFLFKLAGGVVMGDFLKNCFFPLKFFKGNLLSCQTYVGHLLEHFFFFNVSNSSKDVSVVARASGSYCQVLGFFSELDLVLILLPSKKKIYLNRFATCLVGRSANFLKKYIVLGGASFHALLSKRPTVRGVAKNPIDHPHGGRTKTNQPEVSPWG